MHSMLHLHRCVYVFVHNLIIYMEICDPGKCVGLKDMQPLLCW